MINKEHYFSFFSLFDEDRKVVLKIVETLPDKEVFLLKKKYGEDLLNIIYFDNMILRK